MALPFRLLRQTSRRPPILEHFCATLFANPVPLESSFVAASSWSPQQPIAIASHLTGERTASDAHTEGSCGTIGGRTSISYTEPRHQIPIDHWHNKGAFGGRWHSTIRVGVHSTESGERASFGQREAKSVGTVVSTSKALGGERAVNETERAVLKDRSPISLEEVESREVGGGSGLGQDDFVRDNLHGDGEVLILSEEQGEELERELSKRGAGGLIADVDRGASVLSEEEEKELERDLAKMESQEGLSPVETRQERDPDPEREYYHIMKLDEIKRVLEQVKGRDVEVMYVREKCNFTDYMVVVTGRSERHIRAMAEKVVRELTRRCAEVMEGLTPAVEGEPGQEWLLVDAGNIIVHFFTEDVREYYNLEGLWGGNAPKKQRYGPYGELLD